MKLSELSQQTLSDAAKVLTDTIDDEMNPRVEKAGQLTWGHFMEHVAPDEDAPEGEEDNVLLAITLAMGIDNEWDLDSPVMISDMIAALDKLRRPYQKSLTYLEAEMKHCDHMIELASREADEDVMCEYQATKRRLTIEMRNVGRKLA